MTGIIVGCRQSPGRCLVEGEDKMILVEEYNFTKKAIGEMSYEKKFLSLSNLVVKFFISNYSPEKKI
ncbi:hypothetical protein COU54_01085 [Candidatus Pacearchaeota archaeon CG10_big_fil_rev_8_21_14_0_10_31_24]|nr:MAG: hypothetical protein COU54_01085 [Candidatus Pacearchaeota archaeon CG10_big_fil_rev_8_21_14_0_10_31_24]